MSRLVRQLHRLGFLRRAARTLCRGLTLRQSFHGGVICLDAVEHSWAWTGRIRYETFDVSVQELLLELSRSHDWLADIGSNLGAMSLSVALRNPRIRVLAIDPNRRANELLERSRRLNRLGDRLAILHAVAAPASGTVLFDSTGSVTGHVSDRGEPAPALTIAELLRGIPLEEALLVKLDIEGYETALCPSLCQEMSRRGGTALLELHPLGWNSVGDPHACLDHLRRSGAELLDLKRRPLSPAFDVAKFNYVVARWPAPPRPAPPPA